MTIYYIEGKIRQRNRTLNKKKRKNRIRKQTANFWESDVDGNKRKSWMAKLRHEKEADGTVLKRATTKKEWEGSIFLWVGGCENFYNFFLYWASLSEWNFFWKISWFCPIYSNIFQSFRNSSFRNGNVVNDVFVHESTVYQYSKLNFFKIPPNLPKFFESCKIYHYVPIFFSIS